MTTYNTHQVTCGACQSASEITVLTSTNSFGYADLDTRPASMARNTINSWVQRCSTCGGCSNNLSDLNQAAYEIIRSKRYVDQLNNKSHPKLASSFICKSILEEEQKEFSAATWSLINAAWSLDDTGSFELAISARKRSATMLLDLELRGELIAYNKEANSALLIDLLRRSKDFNRASEIIDGRESMLEEDIIKKVINFEKKLISEQNSECYTIGDAIEFAEGTWNKAKALTDLHQSRWWEFWKR